MFTSLKSLAAMAMTLVLAQAAWASPEGQRYEDACRAATAASEQAQRIGARYGAERAAFENGIRDRDPNRAGLACRNYENYLRELHRSLQVCVWKHESAAISAHNYLIWLSGRPYTYGNNPGVKANMEQLRLAQQCIAAHRDAVDTEIRSLWGRYNAARSNRITLLGR